MEPRVVVVVDEAYASSLPRGVHYSVDPQPPERIIDRVVERLAAGTGVLAVYDGAWRDSLRAYREILGRGLNPYQYMPVDAMEPGLAGVPLSLLVEAKASYMAAASWDKARRAPKARVLPSGREETYYPVPILTSGEACVQARNCRACLEACPVDAIAGKPPRIDPYKCTGCGLCTWKCPYQLLEEPGYGLRALDYIYSVLSRRVESAYLVAVCRTSLPELAGALEDVSGAAPAVFIPVDCPGWLSPFHILQAIAWGFHPVTVCDDRSLKSCGGPPGYPEDLGRLPFEPRVLRPGEVAGLLSRMPRARGRITDSPLSLPRTKLVHLIASRYGAGRLVLDSPVMGVVRVDDSRCMLCEACSASCPYGALSLRVEGDRIRLVFRHDRCTACGLCLGACTYNAISLVYEYDSSLYGRELSLADDEVARCRMCGAPLGSMRMMRMLEDKLRRAGASELVLRQLWLCPRCKLRGLASSPRD